MTDTDDEITPLSPEDLERLRALHAAAATLAEHAITQVAGGDFLAALAADAEGEVVVQVAVKGKLARILVRWPAFSAKLETVCELVTRSDRGLAH